MVVRVQAQDFDVGAEYRGLTAGDRSIGAVVSFVGLVRDLADGSDVTAMTLEHYPGMTEKQLLAIEAEAHQRWPLNKTLIVHRFGRLQPADQIVLVITSSAHRQAAFDACNFLMDWLKTQAPFWKMEETPAGTRWVDAKLPDIQAAQRWSR